LLEFRVRASFAEEAIYPLFDVLISAPVAFMNEKYFGLVVAESDELVVDLYS